MDANSLLYGNRLRGQGPQLVRQPTIKELLADWQNDPSLFHSPYSRSADPFPGLPGLDNCELLYLPEFFMIKEGSDEYDEHFWGSALPDAFYLDTLTGEIVVTIGIVFDEKTGQATGPIHRFQELDQAVDFFNDQRDGWDEELAEPPQNIFIASETIFQELQKLYH